MTLEHGSIEVVVDNESTGRLITPDDQFDEANIDGEVERLVGAIIQAEQENTYAANGCLGVWTGADSLGNPAKISVWELAP